MQVPQMLALPCLPGRLVRKGERAGRGGQGLRVSGRRRPRASPFPAPLQELYTRAPPQPSSVRPARRSPSPLAARGGPRPPRRHAWSGEGAGSVLPHTHPLRRGFACAVRTRAAAWPQSRVGVYQGEIQRRGQRGETTPRKANERERGEETKP